MPSNDRAGERSCDQRGCKGHRRFVGGRLDGHVDHLVLTTPSDYPFTWKYPDGSMYERDLDGGTEAVYRCVVMA